MSGGNDNSPLLHTDDGLVSDGHRRIPVFVIIPPRLLLLDIAGPLEVLRQANRVQNSVHFEVRYIGPASSLRTSIGISVAGIEPLPAELPPESWIVVAGGCRTGDALRSRS